MRLGSLLGNRITPIGKSFIKEQEQPEDNQSMLDWEFQELKEVVVKEIFQHHNRWHGIKKALMSGTYNKTLPALTPAQLHEIESVIRYHYEQIRMALGELA